MSDLDEIPSNLELLSHLLAAIEQHEGAATVTIKLQDQEDVEFSIAAANAKSIRYACALVATGNRRLAASTLTEH